MIKYKRFCQIYALLALFLCLLKTNAQQDKKDFVVVLDAGHGGKDTGNRGNGYYEKHIALNITLAIGKQLESIPGISVLYTRKDDRFIELKNRAKKANQADADLFVSIHCDAFTSSRVYGAGTFVLGLHRTKDNFRIAQKENAVIFLEDDYETTYEGFDPNNPESVISLVLMQETYQNQSIEAASTIQNSFVKYLNRKDRTVKQAGFLVLRETYMPSVLVEVGFLTNPKEGAYLNSKKGQREMANTIAKAILGYQQLVNASVTSQPSTIENPQPIELMNPEVKQEQNSISKGIVYKIQIAASSRSIDVNPNNFNGLDPISKEKSNKLYRYFYGNATSYVAANRLKKKAIRKGYKNAFIVAYKDGIKIKVAEAISNE